MPNKLIFEFETLAFSEDSYIQVKIEMGWQRNSSEHKRFLTIKPINKSESPEKYLIADEYWYNSQNDRNRKEPLLLYYLSILIKYGIYIPFSVYYDCIGRSDLQGPLTVANLFRASQEEHELLETGSYQIETPRGNSHRISQRMGKIHIDDHNIRIEAQDISGNAHENFPNIVDYYFPFYLTIQNEDYPSSDLHPKSSITDHLSEKETPSYENFRSEYTHRLIEHFNVGPKLCNAIGQPHEKLKIKFDELFLGEGAFSFTRAYIEKRACFFDKPTLTDKHHRGDNTKEEKQKTASKKRNRESDSGTNAKAQKEPKEPTSKLMRTRSQTRKAKEKQAEIEATTIQSNKPIIRYLATELRNLAELKAAYPSEAEKNITSINTISKNLNIPVKCNIEFGIDATKIATEHYPGQRFKKIHFNFPHNGEPYSTGTLAKLVHDFFQQATKAQSIGDKVYMGLKMMPQSDSPTAEEDYYPAYCYGITEAALYAGYKLIAKRKLNNKRYPGYSHRVTTGTRIAVTDREAREVVFCKINPSDIPFELNELHSTAEKIKIRDRECWSLPKDIETDDEYESDDETQRIQPRM